MGNSILQSIGVESQAKLALVACARLVDFAGSEITTLEIAEGLKRIGWRVAIGAFEIGDEFRSRIGDLGCLLVDLSDDQAFQYVAHFDLAWIHHSVAAYRILLDAYFSSECVVFSSLSYFEPIESPPVSSIGISQYLVNSQENLDYFINYYPELKGQVNIFNNSAPSVFWESGKKDRSGSLKKLAIVSNHVPTEVLDAATSLRERGVEVTVFGLAGRKELITPKVLEDYDAVLTIGKTVQYCIAAQLPVFCYDHFGGDGWLSKVLFEHGRAYNFSGRASRGKVGADVLVRELCDGYSDALGETIELQELGRQYFDLEVNIQRVLDVLSSSKPVNRLSLTDRNIIFRQNRSYAQHRGVIANVMQAVLERDNRIDVLAEVESSYRKAISDIDALKAKHSKEEQVLKEAVATQEVHQAAERVLHQRRLDDLQKSLLEADRDKAEQLNVFRGRERELQNSLMALQEKQIQMEQSWRESIEARETRHVSEKAQLQHALDELQKAFLAAEYDKADQLNVCREREREIYNSLTALQESQANANESWKELISAQESRHISERMALQAKLDELRQILFAVEMEKSQLQYSLNNMMVFSDKLRRQLEYVLATFSWRITAIFRIGSSKPYISGFDFLNEETCSKESIVDSDSAANNGNLDTCCKKSIPILQIDGDEMKNKNIKVRNLADLLSLHGEYFVRESYRFLLSREPDPEGMAYYSGRLRLGVSKLEVLGQLRRSKEAQLLNRNIPDLDAAVRRDRLSRLPLMGWLRPRSEKIDYKLRAMENSLFEIADALACLERKNTLPSMELAPTPIKDGVLVSFVIPIYDRTDVLRTAIYSALNQTVTNIEVILVTDGSPKETLDVVNEFSSDPRVRIFNFPRSSGNAVRGRNKGILEARGRYIAFLDSDDIATPDRLMLSLPYLETGNADVVYGAWQALVDGSRDIEGIANGQIVHSPDANLAMLLDVCVPCQSTVIVRKSFLERSGYLKPSMEYREDHELWARLAYHGARFRSIGSVLTQLRLHDGNNELNFKDADNYWFSKLKSEYKIAGPKPKKIAFVLPGVGISGGIAVVFKHAALLMQAGHDAFVINVGDVGDGAWFSNNPVPIVHVSDPRKYLFEDIDLLFATGWSTAEWLHRFQSKRKLYFVQSDERRFSDDAAVKHKIHDTYLMPCEYLTEAFWIQRLLHDEFGHDAAYVPNGLDTAQFYPDIPLEPKRSGKLRVLLEGPICIPFKGMQDSYAAIEGLDCEVWIVSSAGKPPENWKYDRFFEGVPFSDMRRIYSSCDIFLKMSRIEGFFGPPMEAMACGCSVVVGKVTGYDEYIEHESNALVVEQGDVQGARQAVQRLISDNELRQKLIEGGNRTVSQWSWERSAVAMLDLVSG